jgi:hypothetical protein
VKIIRIRRLGCLAAGEASSAVSGAWSIRGQVTVSARAGR